MHPLAWLAAAGRAGQPDLISSFCTWQASAGIWVVCLMGLRFWGPSRQHLGLAQPEP